MKKKLLQEIIEFCGWFKLVFTMISVLHSDSHCSVISIWGRRGFQTLFVGVCELRNIISTHPPPRYTHICNFLFIRWSNFSIQNIKLQYISYLINQTNPRKKRSIYNTHIRREKVYPSRVKLYQKTSIK